MSPAVGPHYGLEESARITGGLRHAELAAFQLLGAHAPSIVPDRLSGFLAGAALAHAWRAEQLAGLLPVSVGLPDAVACTVSPGTAFDAVLGLLAQAVTAVADESLPGRGAEADPVQGIELLEAIVLVLYPAFSAAYTARLATCNEAADPPLARVLRRVQHDLAVVTTEGEELLAELVATNEVGPPAGAGSAARAASPPSSGPAARPGSAAWRIGETLGAAAAPFGVPSC